MIWRILLTVFLLVLPPAKAVCGQFAVGTACYDDSGCRLPELEEFIQDMYRRAGEEAMITYLPKLRDLISANEGMVDASSVRTSEAISPYPNLIAVPTPAFTMAIVAFTLKGGPTIGSAADLRGVKVAVVRGEIVCRKLAEMSGSRISESNSYGSLVKMLEHGRVDAIITDLSVGRYILKDITPGMSVVSPVLGEEKLYHVLNKKHAKTLLPKLDRAIREMHQDGTIGRLLQRARTRGTAP